MGLEKNTVGSCGGGIAGDDEMRNSLGGDGLMFICEVMVKW